MRKKQRLNFQTKLNFVILKHNAQRDLYTALNYLFQNYEPSLTKDMTNSSHVPKYCGHSYVACLPEYLENELIKGMLTFSIMNENIE